MDYSVYGKELLAAGRRMANAGMTVGTWGNISLRIDEETFMITPSGMNYDTLKEEDLVVMNMNDEIVSGNRKPSIEHTMHRKLYEARPDVNAVIHTHAIFSTAFAIAKADIPAASEELVQIVGEGVKCAKYALPGTPELAEYVAEALGSNNAALLVNHGAVSVGKSMDHAFAIANVLEKTAQTVIYAKIIGSPNIISHEDSLAMQEFVATKYGQ